MNKHIGLLILLVAGNAVAHLNPGLQMGSCQQLTQSAKPFHDTITQQLIELVRADYPIDEKVFLDDLKLLLMQGANSNILDEKGIPLFIYLLHNAEALKIVVEYGPKMSAYDANRALFTASFNNYLESTRVLLENGADSNVIEDTYFTPLTEAINHTNYPMVKLLLKHGANPNFPEIYPPIFIIVGSSWYKQPEILESLLQHGANPNLQFKDDRIALTPLMCAVDQASFWINDLKKRQNPRKVDIDIARISLEKVKILLNHGADYRIKDNVGRDALHPDFSRDNEEVIKIVLDYSK